MNVLARLSSLKRSPLLKRVRKYTNLAFYDPTKVALTIDTFDFVEVDGLKFVMCDQVDSVQRIKGNPWFENIRKTDVVLDLGANIGAITIPMASMATRVVALEPIPKFCDIIRRNARVNKLSNIYVVQAALSENSNERILFGGHGGEKYPTHTFDKLLFGTGKIDVLKVDIEGFEWDCIKPKQCEGIRELRFEFHVRRGKKKQDTKSMRKWEEWLTENNYNFEFSEATPPLCAPFTQCWLLIASRR